MPRIFDNIDLPLAPALVDTLKMSQRADFCVGYFNLRGWKLVDQCVEPWAGGEGACCRLLVGMQALPRDELRAAVSLVADEGIDQATALQLKRRMAEEFREQLTLGAPNNADEAGLRRLSAQIRARKVVVKLFLRHPLHAKLYLLYRTDPNNPITGFLGSSNLTLAGLSKQGELNVDVLDQDPCYKLARWFDDRWKDRWCLDISTELADVIDTSWAREEMLPPYYIYLKMAYHLSQEARAGLAEFGIPRDFGDRLFAFQTAAVKIAAHHVNKRGGVLLGDVVGLGKTLMATALARIFEDDHGVSTLIICPKNLVKMWQSYVDQYGLRARVLSMSAVLQELPNVPARFRLVVIDESHNLRNREGKRYRAIREYVEQSDSKCILLSATPYNKTYLDLSAQLRLFVPEDQDLGIRPEKLLSGIGETEFIRRHQCLVSSLAAFEKSEYADDWRELMRLYMVRRTRSFIQDNYAQVDPASGRGYLMLENGERSYFPARVPKTVGFHIDDADADDPYARLYSAAVVDAIDRLTLPRYGLGNYIAPAPHQPPTAAEAAQIQGLSRAGKRLMGFCRTNLFKRLESGGPAFLQSLDRHILRNYIVLHAIEHDLPIPLGSQAAELLDTATHDEDAELAAPTLFDDEEEGEDEAVPAAGRAESGDEEEDRRRAAEVVGTVEAFFDDDGDDGPIVDLYNEKAGILDGDADTEVDLASYAYQIWKNALDADPSLAKTIPDLPPVVYSTRAYTGTDQEPQGVLLYLRTAAGNDSLAWIDRDGRPVTQSQLAILRAAECAPNTPAIPRHLEHHTLVRYGVEHLAQVEKETGGQLGRPSGARFPMSWRTRSITFWRVCARVA